MISVENIVASGSLGIELDLEVISQELSEIVDYYQKNMLVHISVSMILHR